MYSAFLPTENSNTKKVHLLSTINDDISTNLYSDDIIKDDIYYKKFYALLYLKLNITVKEFYNLLQYNQYINNCVKVQEDIFVFKKSLDNLKEPRIKYLDIDKNEIAKLVLNYFHYPKDIKLSIGGYLLIYIHIKDLLKDIKWNIAAKKILKRLSDSNKIIYNNIVKGRKKLSVIYEMICNCNDIDKFLNIFNNRVSKLSKGQQEYILDLYF